ncbi:lactonase family protein [Deinococcus ruber]|uniref:3-carboxymuconate cyclase n=1 Tax=Deinococcus ruber TaxID=1848197 RepID=A0A918CIZ4_9DEIO|nr:beta-propeller fold lactonase family protein [Deinococcus ruber]GGR24052.1 3-carboxymuconate cyclase [Deinococcus ruber]
MNRRSKLFGIALLTVTLAACAQPQTPEVGGNLYAATNSASGNAIVHYARSSDGHLTQQETTQTGGVGTGSKLVPDLAKDGVDPLFSSDSVVISADHTRLFAVNAGSNSVSAFLVGSGGTLSRIGTYPTGGTLPTSIALSGSLLYVSHAKANDSGVQLTGFRVASDGSLSAISGAQYSPSGKTLIAQTVFSPDGSLLEVSELNTGMIDMYRVQSDGTLTTPTVTASTGKGPFSAAFLSNQRLLVAEAGSGAVSSYNVSSSGALTPISASVANGQKATCWLTLTPDGRTVYASNTSSSNVSVYQVDAGGTLALSDAAEGYRAPNGAVDVGGTASSGPVDAVVSADGKYFYQQYSGLGVVAAYQIGGNNLLTALPEGDGSGLPAIGSEGLAGY